LCTGALAKQTGKPDASLKDHPLPKFFEQGLLVTLSTDDPALFHTDLLNEYALVESLGLTGKRVLELAENSINAAFLPPMDKRELLENFRGAAKEQGLV
jgi:adenosine deaminase